MADRKAAGLPQFTCETPVDISVLEREGVYALPMLLSNHQVTQMREHFERHGCADPYVKGQKPFSATSGPVPRGTHVAFYDDKTTVDAPHALELANHPKILAVVAKYLKAKPTISYMAAWWSFPHGEAAQHAELFHRDYDDLRFLKFFMYLTDVDDNAGPHIYVKGSHQRNALTARKRFSQSDVEKNYASSAIHACTGPAGTMFLEDTVGLHRGKPPSQSPRLIFQVIYSLNEYIAGPKWPVKRMNNNGGAAVDPYINRVYCEF